MCTRYGQVILSAPNFTASVLAVALKNNLRVFSGESGFAAPCTSHDYNY